MDKKEFDAIDKDGAKQAQLSRLITRFDAKYQDYYAPVNCLIQGDLSHFSGEYYVCVFRSCSPVSGTEILRTILVSMVLRLCGVFIFSLSCLSP